MSFPKQDDKVRPATGFVACGLVNLCVAVDAKNAERIAAGQYTADVNLTAATAGMPFPPMGVGDLEVGEIMHDGTTVHIPFLKSYERYTQRLVIVNRNPGDVAYTLMFHTEGDGTTDPTMVEGMAAGGKATVIKVADEVTFTSPTRASATLDIVSHRTMVDVATTMVNQGDQSTDTVVLHVGNRDDNR